MPPKKMSNSYSSHSVGRGASVVRKGVIVFHLTSTELQDPPTPRPPILAPVITVTVFATKPWIKIRKLRGANINPL